MISQEPVKKVDRNSSSANVLEPPNFSNIGDLQEIANNSAQVAEAKRNTALANNHPKEKEKEVEPESEKAEEALSANAGAAEQPNEGEENSIAHVQEEKKPIVSEANKSYYESNKGDAELSSTKATEMGVDATSDMGGILFNLTNGLAGDLETQDKLDKNGNPVIGTDGKKEKELTAESEIASGKLTYANEAGSLISGICDIGMSVKDFVKTYRDDDTKLIDFLSSGLAVGQAGADSAWAIAGIVDNAVDNEGSEVASFFTGNLSKNFAIVTSGLKTIKGAVQLSKNYHNLNEETDKQVMHDYFTELVNISGTAKAVASNVKLVWSQVTDKLPPGLSESLPILDIVSSAFTLILKGIGIVNSTIKYHQSKNDQHDMVNTIANEFNSTPEKIKQVLKDFNENAALMANAKSYQQYNDGKIQNLKDERKKKMDEKFKGFISYAAKIMKIDKIDKKIEKRQTKKSNNAGVIASLEQAEQDIITTTGLTMDDLSIYGFAKEAQTVNKKRSLRDISLFLAELPKIVGGILKLTSVASIAGQATSSSSTVAKLGFVARRKAAQSLKNKAGKDQAKGKPEKGISGKMDPTKSSKAKLATRIRHGITILSLAKDASEAEDPEMKKAKSIQVKNLLDLIDVRVGKLTAKNGKPKKQLKIIVDELSKREF